MSHGERVWPTPGRSGLTVAAAAVAVSATLVGFVVDRSSATSTDRAGAAPAVTVATMPPPAASGSARDSFAPGPPDRLPRDEQGGLSEADGVVSSDVTVFENSYPAVAKLDPALLGALRRAATDAGRGRVTLY